MQKRNVLVNSCEVCLLQSTVVKRRAITQQKKNKSIATLKRKRNDWRSPVSPAFLMCIFLLFNYLDELQFASGFSSGPSPGHIYQNRAPFAYPLHLFSDGSILSRGYSKKCPKPLSRNLSQILISKNKEDEYTIFGEEQHTLSTDQKENDQTSINITMINAESNHPHHTLHVANDNINIKDINNRNKFNNQMNISAIAEQYGFWNDHLSVRSFNMDLHNLAHGDDPAKAQDALEIMQELYRQQPDSPWVVQPDSACYTTVMDGWIHVDEFEKAQALLDRMEELEEREKQQNAHNATFKSKIAPTEYSYMLMAQGWASDSKDDFAGKSAERAEQILRRMQQRNMTVSVKIWSIVLEGWCKRAGIYSRVAIQRAESLLDEMEEMTAKMKQETDDEQKDEVRKEKRGYNLGDTVGPNVLTYTSFIGGLARCKENDLARKAENVLERMQANGVQPDMVAYTAVLNCWAKAISRRERELAASRALHILDLMERMYIQKELYIVKPTLITYSAAIAAIGNSLDPQAPVLAEKVLDRMYKLHESGAIANLKPTTSTFNAVIYALSRAPRSNRAKYARRAEEIVDEMTQRAKNGEKDVQPDVRTWAALLRAWSRSRLPNAAEEAQRVLDKLEGMYENGETTVRPNYVCYTTVMGAWGHSRRKDALDRVEEILKKMEDAYEQTQEADLRPNTVSYVTTIDAFVRRNEKDAAQRSQATVDRMMHLYAKGLGHVRPTRTVFNVLIHAWSKSKSKGAAQNAEKIFQWMEAQYQAGDDLVRPDEVSLCAVLNAWANHAENGGAERALQIWQHMESVSLEERGFKPTITVPNIVIKAIARSKDPAAHRKAEGILKRLEEDYLSGKSYLKPDVTTYSSVINSCAYCVGKADERADALQTALRTFYKLCELKDENPNNITFGTLFKAIQNLMPMGAEREELVRDLFDRCCDEGLVDSFVLSQIRFASPQLYRDLVEEPCGLGGPNDDTSIESVLQNVPLEWSANVIE